MKQQKDPKPNLKLEIGDYVPLFKLRKFVESQKDMPGNTKLSFEFMMTLCFPTIYESVRREMLRKYVEGYHHGEEDARNESQGSCI